MLIDQLQDDLNKALKERDEVATSTLRMVIASLNNAKIAKGSDLSDEEIVNEITKDSKRHKESIEAYKSAARDDLAAKEQAELEVLKRYLPQQLAEEELAKMVEEAIIAVGAKGIADMGRVVGAVMSSAGARADGVRVAALVRQKLSPESKE